MKSVSRGKGKNRWLKRIKVSLFFLVTCYGAVEGQSLKDTINIKEVKVVARKKIEDAGMMTTRIDTLVLQMVKTQTISELLSSYTPVFIKSYGRGSTATASFRGTAPSHTQVYWNGMRLNSPMRGDVDFSLFPVYFIDDLSLQHGGSSLKSGSGALGGSVLIENKPDWNDRFSIRYVQTIESFSTYKEYLNLGYGNGKVQFKTRLFSDRSENDFPFYNYGVLPMKNDVQQNADYRKSGLLQEAYTRFGQHSLSAKLWAYQSKRNLPQLMSFEGAGRKEVQDDQNLRALITWKKVKEKSKLEVVTGLNSSELKYFRSSNESNFVNFDSKSKEITYTGQINYDWTPNENLNFSWSLNSESITVSSFDKAPNRNLGYKHDRLAFSLLNSSHLQLRPDWALSLLVRSEWIDGTVIGFIPSLGSEYWLDEEQHHSIKVNLSRNYHQPTLNDLYWIPEGNPNLKPEDGMSGDVAYAYKKEEGTTSFSGQLTGFASLIDNWIDWLPSPSGASYLEATNVKQVLIRGAEIQASGKVKSANGVLFSLNGNYSYSSTSNVNAVPSVDKSRGKQLIYIPKHKANVFGEAEFRQFYFKVNAPFTGKRYTTSNNEESPYEKVLNPYWLVNTTLGKKVEWRSLRADASLSIENLMDTDHMAILYRPMPGRYYSLTIQLQIRK